MFDASPLIYLAKLEALEVIDELSISAMLPPAVASETAQPNLLYRHPDATLIDRYIRDGLLDVVRLTKAEREVAEDLAARLPALHAGEREVLAVALEREVPAVLFERGARNVAKAIGVKLVHVIDLLFDGTADDEALESRVRTFAQLTNMRVADYDALLASVQRRRLP